MRVIAVPVLEDNYSYLVIDDKTGEAIAVDPAEPSKVLQAAAQAGVNIKSVFTTHHHWDHAGGNVELLSIKPGLLVYGADARIPQINYVVKSNEEFQVGSLTVKGLLTVGHTKGSVSYFIQDGNETAVFTGDTLFVAGCGKFFEGTAEDMYNSLCNVLATLPSETKVYCGHEYTRANLRFALSIEPNNAALLNKITWCQSNLITVPSTIGEELMFNPFMRVHEPAIQQHVGSTNPVEVMSALREMKNSFQ
ncbi:mitochondrial hydroxyacylglutathione hydrolase [Basidiobolus meristosporus CBS 931.73]|uniref:hydroxyacylglutathione hydrolase n=1 Tax=Basidiobolus meristosporus CBS 931.73 TaxID=1314790 RepID=A0A1Y1YQ13_9FUNG|nr:mitochondrial hydroxyacylglutathione hydrolase [Basidiobolus meristosporus CBS 931.73]ORY00110.1 mitochondrial hydroxyacylglutathione hydrolase [Basidiobolus meristosporus CBS 931.73]|eukprot:ORX63352.1 mitochondrial hydroxyacylglutathione hydrolase [Basidiobolus meristosporus CBS 931.73]